MREKLSHRRLHLTEALRFQPLGGGNPVRFDVSFGFEPGGPVRECFSLDFKVGSDRQGEVHIACIIISVALQCGQSMSDLARIIGECDPAAPPQTMLGLIIRAGVALDDYLTAQWAFMNSIPKPATEAAAADEVECVDPKGGQPHAFHLVGAEAGLTCSGGYASEHRAKAESANVSAGVTSRERPAPEQNADDPSMPLGCARSGHSGELSIVVPPDGSPNAGGAVAGALGVTGGESAAHHSESAHGAEFPLEPPRPVFSLLDTSLVDTTFLESREYLNGEVIAAMSGQRPASALFEGECTPEMTAAAPFDAVLDIPAFLRRTSTDGAGA